ncbi:hypothetical protein M5K25_017348 [Dendrobium thyrsiflorum]|uniref:Uncharacterized protein n=1 Tax=Dendrobium thyrsiflorum TaxID=117978 RepID=A0ABD0UU81_DENTH
MVAKKVDALEERLEGEMSQMKAMVDDRISTIEGQVSDLHEMVKKILENQNQTATSEARGLIGRNMNSEIRRRENDVEIIEERGGRYRERHDLLPSMPSFDFDCPVSCSPSHEDLKLYLPWTIFDPPLLLSIGSSPRQASELSPISKNQTKSDSKSRIDISAFAILCTTASWQSGLFPFVERQTVFNVFIPEQQLVADFRTQLVDYNSLECLEATRAIVTNWSWIGVDSKLQQRGKSHKHCSYAKVGMANRFGDEVAGGLGLEEVGAAGWGGPAAGLEGAGGLGGQKRLAGGAYREVADRKKLVNVRQGTNAPPEFDLQWPKSTSRGSGQRTRRQYCHFRKKCQRKATMCQVATAPVTNDPKLHLSLALAAATTHPLLLPNGHGHHSPPSTNPRQTTPSRLLLSILPPRLNKLCMGDPASDHGFLYDEQGRVDILNSPFFDVSFGNDRTADEYVDRVIYQLTLVLEDHLPRGPWYIIESRHGKEKCHHAYPISQSETFAQQDNTDAINQSEARINGDWNHHQELGWERWAGGKGKARDSGGYKREALGLALDSVAKISITAPLRGTASSALASPFFTATEVDAVEGRSSRTSLDSKCTEDCGSLTEQDKSSFRFSEVSPSMTKKDRSFSLETTSPWGSSGVATSKPDKEENPIGKEDSTNLLSSLTPNLPLDEATNEKSGSSKAFETKLASTSRPSVVSSSSKTFWIDSPLALLDLIAAA